MLAQTGLFFFFFFSLLLLRKVFDTELFQWNGFLLNWKSSFIELYHISIVIELRETEYCSTFDSLLLFFKAGT